MFVAACVAIGIVWAILSYRSDFETRMSLSVGTLIIGAIIGVVPAVMSVGVWSIHAGDLSLVLAQDQVIRVQEERIDTLTKRLQAFTYPKGAMLNADTPIASMVAAINNAESELAGAKTERAKAIRSIEKRRRSPFSGVIDFVGDYK